MRAVLVVLLLASSISEAAGDCSGSSFCGDMIRQQQRETCEGQGGTYEYPNCYLPPPGEPAQSLAFSHIIVENHCSRELRVVVAYSPEGADRAETVGWWTLEPAITPSSAAEVVLGALAGTLFPRTQLMQDDIPLRHDNEWELYFYAETTDGGSIVWDGDRQFRFSDELYRMQTASSQLDSNGDRLITLYCDN